MRSSNISTAYIMNKTYIAKKKQSAHMAFHRRKRQNTRKTEHTNSMQFKKQA